jgi:dTDP-glucose 4,6-dehydratase
VRILVTGALGAVGRFLVPALRARGHQVWTCDLYHHHDPYYLRCDVSEFRQVEQLFSGGGWTGGYHTKPRAFDVVYHLAAEFGRWNGEDYYETLWKTNAIGTKNILRMQEREGFRVVYFSSSEVYGDWDGLMLETVMDEHEIRQLNDYAITKWVNEMQVQNSAAMAGTESVRVRLFNTYGPGEYYSPYRSVICLFCYRALHDIPYTVYTGHTRTSTYITDMAETLSRIAERFKPGEVYNIGGLDYHDIKTVSDIILGHLGKSDRDLVTYVEAEPFTTKDKQVDCSKAVRDLGHSPKVPLEEGVPATLEWMKQVYAKSDVLCANDHAIANR